jgi:hypothetical protein
MAGISAISFSVLEENSEKFAGRIYLADSDIIDLGGRAIVHIGLEKRTIPFRYRGEWII